jgi:hypothetical protein
MPTSDPRARAARALALSGVLAWLGACSVERFAIGKLGDALSESGSTYRARRRPRARARRGALLAQADRGPAREEPEHEGLLLAATRGFTQYAYAFVEQDADRVEDSDLARSRELKARARGLYRRAREYGLRALEVRHAGFRECFQDDAATALADVHREDVPLLYWTAASWGLELTLSKDDPEELLGLPQVGALIDRALALDETWDEGAIHAFLITYEPNRPPGSATGNSAAASTSSAPSSSRMRRARRPTWRWPRPCR